MVRKAASAGENAFSPTSPVVMAGLDPAIHASHKRVMPMATMDGRVKPGHDEKGDAAGPSGPPLIIIAQ
jgi:hypothetical protein